MWRLAMFIQKHIILSIIKCSNRATDSSMTHRVWIWEKKDDISLTILKVVYDEMKI